MTTVLNNAQLRVLAWVADGCPDGVMAEGYAHRVSAAALRSRGLIKTRGHGSSWHATITPEGQERLSTPKRQPKRRTPVAPVTPTIPTGADMLVAGRVPPVDAAAEAPTRPAAKPIPVLVPVPETLRSSHPLVRATRQAAVGRRPAADGRLQVGPAVGVIHMVLSREQLPRALRIAQAIANEALRRGWEIKADARHAQRPGVVISVREHEYPIEVHEQTETIPFTQRDIDAWRNERTWFGEERADKLPPPQRKRKQATSMLTLSAPNGYAGGRASWSDGARGLVEQKLAAFFAALEARADADDAAAIEAVRRHEQRLREEELRREHARTAQVAKARAERASAEVQAWRRAREVSSYAQALRAGLHALDLIERERVERWCDWLDEHARRSDPTRTSQLIVGLDDGRDGRGW